jgi:signal transduction histidine kinase
VEFSESPNIDRAQALSLNERQRLREGLTEKRESEMLSLAGNSHITSVREEVTGMLEERDYAGGVAASPNVGPQCGVQASWLHSDRWRLRVCLDMISWALDLPIQSLVFSALRDTYDTWRAKSTAFANEFPTEERFCSFVRDFPEDPTRAFDLLCSLDGVFVPLFTDHCPSCWAAPASYSSPLLRLFRDQWHFKAWEQIFFLKQTNSRHASAVAHGQTTLAQCPGFMHGLARFGMVQVRSANVHLLSFPVLAFQGSGESLSTITAGGASMVNGFLRLLKEKGITPQVDRDTFRRFENVRAAITEADFSNRLSMAAEALEIIGRLEPRDGAIIGRANVQRIAEAAIFVVLMKKYGQIPRNETKGAHTLAFDFRLVGTRPEARPAVLPSAVRLLVDVDSDNVDIEFLAGSDIRRYDSVDSTNTHEFAIWRVNADGHISEPIVHDDLQHLDALFSWILDSAQTRRNAFDFESFLLLRTWFIEQFAKISQLASLLVKPDGNGSKVEPLGCEIASKLARSASAEICTINYYNHRTNEVVVLGVHHHSAHHQQIWLDALQHQLSRAARTRDGREHTIVYRSIDTGEPVHCCAYDPETDCADPEENKIFRFPEHMGQPRSANAAPVKIYGRVWGAIAILGIRPYQFAPNVARTLSDLCDLFSLHIFQQWQLRHLDLINYVATDEDLALHERFDRICLHLSDLLLAQSATLWLKHPNDPEQFCAFGWNNRPDLQDLAPNREAALERPRKAPNFRINDADSIMSKVFDSGASCFQEIIGEGLLSCHWLTKPHTSNLQALGFRYACFIPIRVHGKPIGAISLFNSRSGFYQNGWHPIMDFVAEEIALTVQAVLARTVMQTNMLSPLRHEVVPSLRSLKATTIKLSQLLGINAIRDLDSFRDINIQMNDLRHGLAFLSTRIDDVVSGKQLQVGALVEEDIVVGGARDLATSGSKSPAELRQLFNEVAHTIRRSDSYRRKNLSINLMGPAVGPHLMVDRSNLKTILTNVIDNAAKYSPVHGAIRGIVSEDNRGVTLAVWNYGPPLSTDEQDRIFDREFRGFEATRRNIPGSGIGLYHVKKIAELYHIPVFYQQVSASGDSVRHEFRLRFPRKLLRDY